MSTKRALVIGINQYPLLPGRDLVGCVHDAQLMQSILVNRFGFPAENVRMLTDGEATQAGIRSAFQRLLDETGTDDVVVVFYAGHGSQMTDREGDEPDGLDETIVPHDSGRDPQPNRDITDDELYFVVLELSKKTPHITLIFDSCHSATITRDVFGVGSRSIPADERGVEDLPPSPIADKTPLVLGSNLGPSGWLPLGSRYVLLAGCRAEESSFEHRLHQDGQELVHGALTFFLARELSHAETGSTYRDVFERVSSQVTVAHSRQHPQIEGTLDRELFGTRDIAPMRFVAITGRIGSQVTLAAGGAQGLTVNSAWAIYASGVKQIPENAVRLGRVQITKVGAVTSEATIESESQPGIIVEGTRAVEESRCQASMKLAVEVVAPDGYRADAEQLRNLIQQYLLLELAPAGAAAVRVYVVAPRETAGQQDAVPQLGPVTHATWAVVGQDGKLIMPPHRVDEQNAVGIVCDNLEKICRYENALQLENPDRSNELDGQIEFVIKRQRSDGQWVPAEADATGAGVTFEEGDRLAFTMTNKYRQPLYITLLDFGLTGCIDQAYPHRGASEALAPGRTVTIGERAGEELELVFPDNFPFVADPAEQTPAEGTEHLKLFVTTAPADFSSLLQAGVRDAAKDARATANPLEQLLEFAMVGGGTRELKPVKRPPAEQWTTVTRSFSLRRKAPKIRLPGDDTAVVVGDKTLRTPGLTGVVQVHASYRARTRSAELTTDRLEQVLAIQNCTLGETIEIMDARETGPARAVTPYREPALELETPEPGAGWEQVVLYADESGVLSWNFTEPASRGENRRTYVLRRHVPQAVPAGERGLIGAVGRKLLKMVLLPLVDPLIGKISETFARRWEERHRPYRLRMFTPDDYRAEVPDAWHAGNWQKLASGRSLLLIHGTFSRAHSAFGALPPEFVGQLWDRYQGRVFAFDHFTMSDSPQQNVKWFLNQIPDGIALDLDVVCHSRGGLVSRVLAEKLTEVTPRPEQTRIHKVVFVASPNAGTRLVDNQYLGDLLDSLTNLINFLPDNGATDILEGVLTVVRQLSVGVLGGLDGLQSMRPGGPFQQWLNQGPRGQAQYYALASNFEPANPGWKDFAKNRLMDCVFQQDNDLVVPTAGVFENNGSPMFPIADRHVFPPADAVSHTVHVNSSLAGQANAQTLCGPF
ncbi:MAG: caspase family protein [Planctomycetota bacterium]|nr:caspase family protein [Planctomycetota bacterium]